MLTLDENNKLRLTLPHDFLKFRQYLINHGLCGYNAYKNCFEQVELVGGMSSRATNITSNSVGEVPLVWHEGVYNIDTTDSLYRIPGDRHWPERLFYVENVEKFHSGEFVLEFKVDSDWAFYHSTIFPGFLNGVDYRISRKAESVTADEQSKKGSYVEVETIGGFVELYQALHQGKIVRRDGYTPIRMNFDDNILIYADNDQQLEIDFKQIDAERGLWKVVERKEKHWHEQVPPTESKPVLCRVWDNEKDPSKYTITQIVDYESDSTTPFKHLRWSWKNAIPLTDAELESFKRGF